MIVFKTFLRVLNKCKAPIIIYTIMLVIFGGIKTTETDTSFTAEKPDILIINEDRNSAFTENLISYIKENSNIKEDIKDDEDSIKDALFYRDVNYIIYIPSNFGEAYLNGKNPEVEIKSTGDYQASLANILLEKYLKTASIYLNTTKKEEDLINKINESLKKETNIEVTSKLDTNSLASATSYYNFTNYCLLGGSIYIICLILSTFKSENIRKRTIISSMSDEKYNLYLLISNSIFAFILWILYVLLSFILVGKIMFTMHGLCYIINSFVFSICALTIAFLIGNMINNKNAINGIVNVIALGSSFLCGAFVPMKFLPDMVIKVAHILPSYWFIKSNETIKTLEVINFESLKPILINNGIVIIFSIVFIIASIVISNKKRKIG